MTKEPILELRAVDKFFADFVAIDGIDLAIEEGEFFTIVGPSGSGKTTLIRMLTGMEKPSNGDIRLRGRVINDLPANKRPTCMVFQSLALFPHRTVGQNIEFPLKIKGVPAAERRARANELLRLVHLPEDYHTKRVQQCSGGERQRVALARALSFDPEILFFDEPLSALDFRLRKLLEKELKDIHRASGKTFVYITHSLEEAMVMSDRIGILQKGKFVQIGTPDEIYDRPANRFVSQFIGEVNMIKVERDSTGQLLAPETGQRFTAPPMPPSLDHGWLIIRPENLRLGAAAETAENRLAGVLTNEYSLGSRMQYQVRLGETSFLAEQLRDEVKPGAIDAEIAIGWNALDSMVVPD
jgi:spermidine/putrescine transport system ATP-binding protein